MSSDHDHNQIEDRLRATLRSVAASTVVPPINAGDAPTTADRSAAPLAALGSASPRGPMLAWRLIGAAAVLLVLIGSAAIFSRGSDVTLEPSTGGPGTTTGTVAPSTFFPAPTNGELVDANGVPIRPSATLQDHWHVAYDIYLCDYFAAPLSDVRDDVNGIHTHGDGIVHIHPFTAAASGANATLGLFMDQVGVVISDEAINLPNDGALAGPEGRRCDNAGSHMVVYRWYVDEPNRPPDVITSGIRDIPFDHDRMAYTIAFVAPGVIPPKPSSIASLDHLQDVPPTGGTLPPTQVCIGGVCTPTSPTVITIPNDGNGAPTTQPSVVVPPQLPQTYCPAYNRWKDWMIAAPGAQSTLRPEFRTYMDGLIDRAPDEGTLKVDLALLRDMWSDPNAQPNDGSTEVAFRIDNASMAYCALHPG
jgi:hypothetical protein